MRDQGAPARGAAYALGATPTGLLTSLARFNPAIGRIVGAAVAKMPATATVPTPGAPSAPPVAPAPPVATASGISTTTVLIGSGVLAVGAFLLLRRHKR